MEVHKKNVNNQLEINNLIDDAVNNAVARRNSVEDSEDALQSLSNEGMANVAGGFVSIESSLVLKNLITCGGFLQPFDAQLS
ncbi:hypothetical protein [Nostoc commune]|uniref:hypothetical protein n=1 Tax=Nostoc commune TaxID=1178 RepID=UPI0018C67677|nr:hypothetical protein [Nostoc commune]MBG1261941.1 hypothetical protein [Nostoc commune BAE]